MGASCNSPKIANSSTVHLPSRDETAQLNLTSDYIGAIHRSDAANDVDRAPSSLKSYRILGVSHRPGRSLGPTGHGGHSQDTYSVSVRNQRQVVDYALQRRALLAEVRSGRV